MWKFHRAMTRTFFVKDRFNDLDIFAVHTDKALRQAKARLSEDLVSRFTLDSATQFLFGTDVGSLNAGLAYPNRLGRLTRQHPTVIKDELVNLLVAGRDTTASLLTFSLYMLAKYPKVTQRLREEILLVAGTTEYPSYNNIHEMRYLRAFLNEVLRLYPPVPLNSREANKDTLLESKTSGALPLYIPAGTRVTYSVFVIHRRTDLWGPDALVFDPDRFIDERLSKYLTPNPFIFCPFNAGPRICLGQQFAYHEASFFLVRLLQQYSTFTLARDAQPLDSLPPKKWEGAQGPKGSEEIHPQIHMTISSKGGLWVRMKEAAVTQCKLGAYPQ
ncbi:cytochrome P450 [Cyathus striatus]|nr:cytochrome P450 [Cyathus striatus]